MPIYEYLCPRCQTVQEDFTHLAVDAPAMVACRACGADAGRIPSVPIMMESAYTPGLGRTFNPKTPLSGAKNIFEGIKGLENHDGKNRANYRSERVQVDLGGR